MNFWYFFNFSMVTKFKSLTNIFVLGRNSTSTHLPVIFAKCFFFFPEESVTFVVVVSDDISMETDLFQKHVCNLLFLILFGQYR